MAKLSTLITALENQRVKLYNYLKLKGISSVQSTESLTSLVSKVILIDNGIADVRNGYELFINNTTMTELPTFLDFPSFNSMYKMCYGCTQLTHVGQLDTSNVTNMMWAFYGCSSLKTIAGLITNNISSASEMFHGCTALEEITHPLDFSNVNSKIDTTFVSCKLLKNVRFNGTIKVDIYMNGCPKLTVDSLLSLLNALSSGVTGKLCKIGSTNLAKLSADQKAIATNKGWILD